MSGGERGGGSVFKQGDAVWVPLYVAGERGDAVLMAANPAAAKAGRGSAVVMRSEVLPYCDALPGVARWLAETPDAVHDLRSIAYDAQQFYTNGDDDEASVDLAEACRSLLKALTGGEGAGGDA